MQQHKHIRDEHGFPLPAFIITCFLSMIRMDILCFVQLLYFKEKIFDFFGSLVVLF
jgi:hypothetical protein